MFLNLNLIITIQSLHFRLVSCDGLMVLLGLWLSSIDQDKLLDSLIVGKILEILSKMRFSVDLLVKYKFGRVIKKITQQKGKLSKSASVIFDLASKLYENWSILANQSEIPTVPRRKSDETIKVAEPIYVVPSDYEQSVEIHHIEAADSKEKVDSLKRGSGYNNEPQENNVVEKKTKIITPVSAKKSVKFPETPGQLCKIIIFERAPEEYEYLSDGSASRDSYLHADKGEASAAFNRSLDIDELYDFKPWTSPEKIEGIPTDCPDGIDSEEKIIQRQRERSVLSATYYSVTEIPPSPSEEDVDVTDDMNGVKTIPIRHNEAIVKHLVSIKVPSLVVPQIFTAPELFTNLSNNSFNASLFNPFVTAPPAGPAYSKPLNQEYFPSDDLMGHSSSSSSSSSNSSRRNSSIEGYSRSASTSTSSYESSRSSKKDHENQGKDSHYSSKSLCRHYRPGRRNSCWLGPDCKFIHKD